MATTEIMEIAHYKVFFVQILTNNSNMHTVYQFEGNIAYDQVAPMKTFSGIIRRKLCYN